MHLFRLNIEYATTYRYNGVHILDVNDTAVD